MRKAIAIIGIVLTGWMFTVAPASASDRPAQSFVECVARGGEVRKVDDDVACRHTVSGTMRTYLSGETACGEEVQYEIWDEVRYGTVTFAFQSHRVEELPEVGATWEEAAATPIPCLDPEG